MAIDAITLEVIRNKLDVIADEMQITLIKSAYSSVVKEGLDASSALFDTKGQTMAQATAIPCHLGMLIPAVKAILENFPAKEMEDGDVYIINDPYAGGTHLPDIIIVVPLLYEGEVVSLGCSIAHHQDVGGKAPGSTPTDAIELYQEGLIIPPLKLYEKGVPNETFFKILTKSVRIPDVVTGDLRAQIAAGNVGKKRMLELFKEYGKTVFFEHLEELYNRAEEMTRAAIEEVPDGDYTFYDFMDNDGIILDKKIRIQARVKISGSDMKVDFEGTDPQALGPINSVPSSTNSCVYYLIRAITDPSIPNNAGCYRPVQISLPKGTLVNPNHPAPVSGRTVTIKRIADVLLGAMAKAIPEKIPAASSGNLQCIYFGGVDPLNGETYVASELGAGGMGARPTKDGIDVLDTDVSNCMNIPVEAVEMNFPLMINKYRLRDDSGGAGEFRGGLGFEKVFEAARGEVRVTHRGERNFTAPWGMFGGLPAKKWESKIIRKNGKVEKIPAKLTFTLKEGDQLHLYAGGGGGYGDPLRRKPEAVLEDVLDRKVSIKSAREDYGVVIEEKDMKIIQRDTEKLREKLDKIRGKVNWIYDRGDELGKEE